MAKIRLQDLAKRMNVAEQDLLFKFRSIGVRVEGEDAMIDTDIIKALLEGKKIAGPQREVILRDRAAPPTAPRRRPISSLRPPTGPMRPNRRRQVVHKHTIRTLTPTESKPKPPTPEEIAAKEIAAEEAARATRTPTPESRDAPAATPLAPPTDAAAAPPAQAPATTPASPSAATAPPALTETPPETPPSAPPTVDLRTRRERQQEREAEKPAEDGPRRTLTVADGLQVRDLAEKMGVKAKDLLKALFERGVMATVNHVLEPDLAVEIAEQMGFDAVIVSFEEEIQLEQEEELGAGGDSAEGLSQVERPPIVTIMGHVDHGKTSLLDAIRKSRLTEGEFGGITQHIAAYQVENNGGRITFLDTPGHEAFTQLRARGAKVTDIVVLVVAADDGVMPQTAEAIDHAQAADVPIIVAINKMDRPGADADRVRAQLAERGLVPESYGGEVITVPMSAMTGEGIDELLDQILLVAELEELTAPASGRAVGIVLEAHLDRGRGPVATVLVERGTLRIGEPMVAGAAWGRVRAMTDDRGAPLSEAGPSMPVEVLGLGEVARSGDLFVVAPDEKTAGKVAETREHWQRQASLAGTAGGSGGGARLEDIFKQVQAGETATLNLVLKADVHGSLEAVTDSLRKLEREDVKLSFVSRGVGGINENDVQLAAASEATIIGFNVRPDRNARQTAETEDVEVRLYEIIYDLISDVQNAMVGLLEPEFEEIVAGEAQVRQVFRISGVGPVAGCVVEHGNVRSGAKVRFLRDGTIIWKGSISSLRHFQDDVAEVSAGMECGIGLSDFSDLKEGDVIETYTEREIARVA